MSDNPARLNRWLPRFQFSLRTIMIIVAMTGCFLGGWKVRDAMVPKPEEREFLVEGKVLAVTQDQFDLSAGSDDGIGIGTVCQIMRDNRVVAEVIVTQFGPDRSVAKLKSPALLDVLSRSALDPPISKGDRFQGTVRLKRYSQVLN